MDLGLRGKTAVVTGAASGIGKAIALAFAREGSSVAVCDVNEDALVDVTEEIKKLQVPALACVCDVSVEEQCLSTIVRLQAEFGGIDVLINNAGVFSSQTLYEIAATDWDRVLQVNLKSAFVLSRAVLPSMIENGWGRIVNVSSMAGKVGGRRNKLHRLQQ